MSSEVWNAVSDSAKHLLHKMLVVDVYSRITADDALKHPWIQVTSMCVCVCVSVCLFVHSKLLQVDHRCVESRVPGAGFWPGVRVSVCLVMQTVTAPSCLRPYYSPLLPASRPYSIQYNTIQYNIKLVTSHM